LVERECRVGRKAKPRAVGKRDRDKAVGAGLDDIAVENTIAGANTHHATTRPCDAYLTVGAVDSAESGPTGNGIGAAAVIGLFAAGIGHICPVTALIRGPVGHSQLRVTLVERERVSDPISRLPPSRFAKGPPAASGKAENALFGAEQQGYRK
jgi:hypothetical protein